MPGLPLQAGQGRLYGIIIYCLPRTTTPLTLFKMLVVRPKPVPGLLGPSE